MNAEAEAWSYGRWSEALAGRFFRPEYAGEHVLLYADDATIGEIRGTEPSRAVGELVRAVQSKTRRGNPRHAFQEIGRETRLWKARDSEGPPPCLPLLALAALAATRMGRAADRGGNNYYEPFCELLDLGLDEEDVIASYRDEIGYLWEQLRWWLDEKQRGALGFSTIVEHPHFTYIGYADSQTLFAASDRDKLSHFFRWLGLEPGEPISEEELLVYFRGWVARRDDLSLGAQVLLEGERYPTQLTLIIKRAFEVWEGVVRDEEGRPQGEVVVTLTTFPRIALSFAARQPLGAPSELHFSHRGRGVTFRALHRLYNQERGWYDVELEPTDRDLVNGFRLAAGGISFHLPPAQIHVLHKNQELGCWASTTQLRPTEPAWLLVHDQMRSAVEGYLDEYAQEGWCWADARDPSPEGWSLVRDVIIDLPPSSPPEGLSKLVPRFQMRISLQGGLPLPRGDRAYLTGGEPDLWLPAERSGDSPFEIQIDGEHVGCQPDQEVLRLAELGLEEGPHTVEMPPLPRLSFATIRSLGNVAPRCSEPIEHRLHLGADGSTPASARDEPSEIIIKGALVTAPMERPPPPLLLPRGAQTRVVLGSRPGEVAEADPPERPRWAEEVGLYPQDFEFTPGFAPVWVLTTWRLQPEKRIRLREPRPVESELADEDAVERWCRAILEMDSPVENHTAELWREYRRRARELDGA